MSACRLTGGAPYYPRDFGPSPERSLAAFVSVGPPGCSQQYAVSPVLLAVLQAVLGCSPCSSGTHGMYFSTYMPCHLDMPPCGRLSGLAPSSDLAGSSEEGPLKRAFFRRSLSRAPRLNHPRATAPSRQGQGVGVARGVEGVSVCGLIWFDGMPGRWAAGLARRVSGAAVCRLFSAAPAPVGRYLLITLCDYFITLETHLIVFYATIVCRTEFPANIYARVYSHIYHSYGGHCSSSNTALFPLSCT